MLVIEVPICGFLFKILRSMHRHVGFDHVIYFTKETLLSILEQNLFAIQKSKYVGRTLSFCRLTDLIKAKYNNEIGNISLKIFKKLKCSQKTVYINLHDIYQVYCTKKT